MYQRPALAAATAITIGILLARWTEVSWIHASFAALACSLVSLAVFLLFRSTGNRTRIPVPALAALCFAAGAMYAVHEQLPGRHHISQYLQGTDSLHIRCRVIDEPQVSDGKSRLLTEVTAIWDGTDSLFTEGKAYVTVLPDKRTKELPVPIPYGAEIEFTSLLLAPGAERNPGEFSYRDYLALNGIHAAITVRGYASLHISEKRRTNPFFEHIIFPSKEFVIATIRTVMTGDEANFLIGLLLGDRTEISREIKNAFMNTGTIHVLAVSGSHVVLVAEIIIVLVGLFRLPRTPKFLLVIMMLFYYMYLTGATPSVVRATLMMAAMVFGRMMQQRTDIYNMLGVAGIIILMFDPKQLFDVGFQLSFSAVFSIVYFYPKLNALIPRIPEPLEEFRLMQWLWQLFAVSLAAQIGTLPFTAYYFGRVSIVSLLANLVVVPLVGLIVTIGLSGALLGILSMWIASCFSEVNQVIAVVTLNFVRWAEQVPFAVLETATFGVQETFFYSVIIGILFNLGSRTLIKRFAFAGMSAAVLLVYLSFFDEPENMMTVTFLDVGQGDGAVIRFPTGEVVLVDAGPATPEFDAGENTVAPFLRRNGIERIDAVITTHPHADHLGGVPYILEHFDVSEAVDAGQRASSRLYWRYSGLLGGLRHRPVRSGDMLTLGNARLYILHPAPRFLDNDSADGYHGLNDASVVFQLHYGSTRMLFTGDAETDAEEYLVHRYGDLLSSDLLKAGHHGSSTSSSELFIEAVRPAHTVLSVAQFNKFRHPSRKVIERLTNAGSEVYRTDRDGAVIFTSDGATLRRSIWRSD